MADPDPQLVERFRRDLATLAGGEPAALAVAVSGGPDSLALLLLARAALLGRVHAATVDHRLRPESAAEAAEVAAICARLDIPHSILPVTVNPSEGGVQAGARSARYEALAAWMAGENLSLLLTAHHSDDQAETLLMRLLRGSGVAGLAGIRSVIPFPAAGTAARILRPLLGWRRSELAAVVAASGLAAADDPGNRDPAYDRARLRARLAETLWLEPVPLARSAAFLAEAEEALEWAAERLEAERLGDDGPAVTLDPAGIPAEILRRLVLRALRRVEPAADPRAEALCGLIETLRSGGSATLAGVKASGGMLWCFEPAPPRRIA